MLIREFRINRHIDQRPVSHTSEGLPIQTLLQARSCIIFQAHVLIQLLECWIVGALQVIQCGSGKRHETPLVLGDHKLFERHWQVTNHWKPQAAQQLGTVGYADIDGVKSQNPHMI